MRYGLAKTKHTAEIFECIQEVNGHALERHLFSCGNYPDNIWPVDRLWEGPVLTYQCAV